MGGREPEQWKPIPDWEGLYEVSDQGRVRSLDREVAGRNRYGEITRTLRGRVLKAPPNSDGYLMVSLCRDGSPVSRKVHVLVAVAFLGERPEGMDVCHNNGNPADNRLLNLRYDTRAENITDAVRHGTHNNGRAGRTHCPKNHPLSLPNLVPSSLKRGERGCLACNRAHASVNNAKRLGRPVPDFTMTADIHYRKIMEGGK